MTTCPVCEREVIGAHRLGEPWLFVQKTGLFGGTPRLVRERNPNREGVVIHRGGARCHVVDIDEILATLMEPDA